MNLLEIIEFREKLKADLAVVDRFIEIAKLRGADTGKSNGTRKKEDLLPLAQDESNVRIDPTPQRDIPGLQRGYGNLTDIVRDAIKYCPDKYNVNDVYNVTTNLGKGLTKLQVATVLSRLTLNNSEKTAGPRDELVTVQSRGPQAIPEGLETGPVSSPGWC